MIVLSILGILAAMSAPASALQADEFDKADPPDIVQLREGDPEMSAAIRNARAALDDFLAMAANPPEGVSAFSLKVGLPVDDKNTEFVWVRPFRREGADFVGRLVNTPRDFPALKHGQQIAFDRANIIDSAYRENGRLKGHRTTCVLLKRMPAARRAEVLADNPIVCDR